MKNCTVKRPQLYRTLIWLCSSVVGVVGLLGCQSNVAPSLADMASGSYLVETWSPLYDLTKPDATLPVHAGDFIQQYMLVTKKGTDRLRIEAYLVNSPTAYKFVFPAVAVVPIDQPGYENQYNLLDPATRKVIGLYWQDNRLSVEAPDSTGHLIALVAHRGYRTQ